MTHMNPGGHRETQEDPGGHMRTNDNTGGHRRTQKDTKKMWTVFPYPEGQGKYGPIQATVFVEQPQLH